MRLVFRLKTKVCNRWSDLKLWCNLLWFTSHFAFASLSLRSAKFLKVVISVYLVFIFSRKVVWLLMYRLILQVFHLSLLYRGVVNSAHVKMGVQSKCISTQDWLVRSISIATDLCPIWLVFHSWSPCTGLDRSEEELWIAWLKLFQSLHFLCFLQWNFWMLLEILRCPPVAE